MTAAGLGIIYPFPYRSRAVPSPLVCSVALTGVSVFFALDRVVLKFRRDGKAVRVPGLSEDLGAARSPAS